MTRPVRFEPVHAGVLRQVAQREEELERQCCSRSRARWRGLRQPAGNRVVSDGATLKVYEAANKQMFEQSIDKSQYPAAPPSSPALAS